MKICKIKITKKLTGNRCDNIYPQGYDPHKINVVAYDEEPLVEGDNIGYCIGLVDNDFIFTDQMVKINKIESGKFIERRAKIITDVDVKVRFSNTRKQILNDAEII